MVWTKNYVARFENEYGEQWLFEYNPITRTGTLRGTDVGEQSYRVVDGRATGLLLNDNELRWLRRVWAEARSGEPPS
jgi:hypothetical protein